MRYDGHSYPLTDLGETIGASGTKRRWWRCERCGQEFTDRTPTQYAGCCNDEPEVQAEAEAERQNDRYMERGQPGGKA